MEGCSQVVLIIFLQEGTVNDTEDVLAVIVPIALNQVSGNSLQLEGKTGPAGRAEAFLQGCGDVFLMLRLIFPKKRAAGIGPAACVGNVEYIFDARIIPGTVQKRDPLGTAPHKAVHGVIPDLVARAGSRLRSLREDQELLIIGVLIQSGRCFKKCRPSLEAFG